MKQNNIVNSGLKDEWTAELVIIASNDESVKLPNEFYLQGWGDNRNYIC